jgi:hypothetical protein
MFLPTVYTSLVFVSNAVAAFLQHEYIYGTALSGLVISSCVFHTDRSNRVLFWFDQFCVMSVFLIGAVLLYKKWDRLSIWFRIGPFFTLFTSMYMYFVGYWTNTMCYAEDEEEGEYTHCLLHYICCFGHHCLLLDQ